MDTSDTRRPIPAMRRPIEKLTPSVVNKIAAGEVIERPASVVKELMENAVDAGSRQVTVRLEKGGLDHIRVADDGHGIRGDELPLAVASHATSKIRSADDLFAVHTLGFRGEALASIAEISKLQIRTRAEHEDAGSELVVNGGELSPVRPCACAVGTSIEVDNLFFNTPVRRKFVRTAQTEFGHASEAFVRIALAHPEIHFVLQHNTRTIHDLPPVTDWRMRIAALFGPDLANGLMWVQSEHEQYHLSGYVANPVHSRSNNKLQYVFLNGRHIRDRALQHALGEAYRGLLLTGRFPICFLQLQVPANEVDVNVHPTKLEVRFQEAGRIYSQLLGTLRSEFLAADLTAQMAPTDGPHPSGGPDRRTTDDTGSSRRDRRDVHHPASSIAGPHTGQDAVATFLPFPPMGDALRRPLPTTARSAAAPDIFGQVTPLSTEGPLPTGTPAGRATQAAPAASADSVRQSTAQGRTEAIQIHDRYLVASCVEGLLVIDQHALHERVLYEQLREKVLSEAVEVQRLLTPEPVDLTPDQAAAVLQHQETLAAVGLPVEPFGGSTILVTGYPALLANVRAAQLLEQAAERLLSGDGKLERRDLIDSLLHMMSCKGAIKAGDPLSTEEIDALLQYRHLVQDAHHCPHGRPTTLLFTREELDRQFRRI